MVSLGMITLAVEHWHETVAFYHECLGLPMDACDVDTGRARLRADPGIIIEIHTGGWSSDRRKTTRLNPVALCLRVDDVARAMSDLEARGAWIAEDPVGSRPAVLDPDGNRVYLYDGDEPLLVPDGWELEGESRVATISR